MVTIRRSVKTGRQVVRRLGETRTLVGATATAFRPWKYLWEMDYREDGKSEVLEILCADSRRFWAGDKQSVYGPGLKLHPFRQDLRADSSGPRPGCSAAHPAEQMRFEGCAIPAAVGALSSDEVHNNGRLIMEVHEAHSDRKPAAFRSYRLGAGPWPATAARALSILPSASSMLLAMIMCRHEKALPGVSALHPRLAARSEC